MAQHIYISKAGFDRGMCMKNVLVRQPREGDTVVDKVGWSSLGGIEMWCTALRST